MKPKWFVTNESMKWLGKRLSTTQHNCTHFEKGWVFWDETEADCCGPYKSFEAAQGALIYYATFVLDPEPKTIEQLAKEQGVTPIKDVSELFNGLDLPELGVMDHGCAALEDECREVMSAFHEFIKDQGEGKNAIEIIKKYREIARKDLNDLDIIKDKDGGK